jgi:CRISPR-associated protein Csx16
MSVYFVSRHPGAIEWAARQGLAVDRQIGHLDVNEVGPGDVVIGSLPVNLAAGVCARGARYLHLSLELPVDMRGRELSADDMHALGARIEEFRVERKPC